MGMGLGLKFRVRSISSLPLEGFSLNFGQMFALVKRCEELMTQPCNSSSRSQLKGMGLGLKFHVRFISSLPLEGFSLKFG